MYTPYLPWFNLNADVWRLPDAPPGPATFNYGCQLYIPSRGLLDITPGDSAAWQPPIWLRVPKDTDVYPGDVVECPAASGRMYLVRWVDDCHKGMPNEYRVCLMEQTFQPEPIP